MDSDIDASVDLLGKVVTDLQSDLVVGEDNIITGTLKYVDDYTGFSGDVAEQSGNYLVLHASAIDGATITVKLIGGLHDEEKTLDSDGLILARITSTAQKIKVFAYKDGVSATQIYKLTGLTLEESE